MEIEEYILYFFYSIKKIFRVVDYVFQNTWFFRDKVTGRPGGVAGYPRACYKSISWIRVPPSAYWYELVGTFSCAHIDSRKARRR